MHNRHTSQKGTSLSYLTLWNSTWKGNSQWTNRNSPFNGIWKFIIMFTKAHHSFPFSARWIQSTSIYPIPLQSVFYIILSSIMRSFMHGNFHSGFPTTILSDFFIYSTYYIFYASLLAIRYNKHLLSRSKCNSILRNLYENFTNIILQTLEHRIPRTITVEHSLYVKSWIHNMKMDKSL